MSGLRRIGLIGDVHAEDGLLTWALEHLAGLGVDRTLCVGDVVDGPGDAGRCIELLRRHEVLAVAGNHDRWFLAGTMRDLPDATQPARIAPADRAFLADLPKTRHFETVAGPLLLCHGLGSNDMADVRPDDAGYALASNAALGTLLAEQGRRLVVCGHSHRRMVRRIDHLTLINAGTLYREHEPSFLLLDLGRNQVDVFELDVCAGIRRQRAMPLDPAGHPSHQ